MVAQTIAIQQQALGRGSADLPLDPVYIMIDGLTITIAELIQRAMVAQTLRQHEGAGASSAALRTVLRAQEAFARNSFCVLVNGRQAEDLNEQIICTPQTAVTFLRLESLA